MRYCGASRSAKASMICWDVQAAVGCSVTLKCSTSRRRCSSTMNTNSTRIVIVGTVKKSIDTKLADVVVKERFPGLSRWPPEGPEDSGDRALGDPDAEHLQFSVEPGRTPQRIGRHHALNESAYLDGGRRSAAAPAIHPGQMRPELPEALPLPPDDRVGLNVQQRSAPGAPNARQTDPEQPIETGQHRSFPLSPEGSELQAESSVFDSNGLVSAQQETNERITDKRR